MKKILAVLLCAMMLLSCTAALAEKVGVSMPTKDLQRWNQDGANMEAMLTEAGYEVDLQFASNDVKTQLDQVENMISEGANVLVISAIEGSSLGEALQMAKDEGIPVIAYDRPTVKIGKGAFLLFLLALPFSVYFLLSSPFLTLASCHNQH